MDLIIFLILMGLGYGFGRIAELRHFQSIIERERELRHVPVIASKFPPATVRPPQTQMVMGSVVISVDYFKRFLAQLRNLVGGQVKAYEGLLERARREAILRMKEEAHFLGASMVFNIKLETASISKGRKGTIGSVEVLAYGTAVISPQTVNTSSATAVDSDFKSLDTDL